MISQNEIDAAVATMTAAAESLSKALPEGWGFALLVMQPVGPANSSVRCLSNIPRTECMKIINEFSVNELSTLN